MKQNPVKTCWAIMIATASLTQCVSAATFGDDTTFLKGHTDVIILSDKQGAAKVAVVPAWQGRIMTSSSAGDAGFSYGWINRELITSGRVVPHMNAFGGEDRFWMGPEGGQFSIFFEQGAKFEFANWFTPAIFDTLPFKVISTSGDQVVFGAKFALTNYSGTRFEIEVKRNVHLLDAAAAWKALEVPPVKDVSLVAYETDNRITNKGEQPWSKSSGLLSIWLLGMYKPTPTTTIVVPFKEGPEATLGPKVNDAYFGKVPPDYLIVKDHVLFFRGDGTRRGKIGISPARSLGMAGSYDAGGKVLTLVTCTVPARHEGYVNSMWEIQKAPFGGDALNSYNDGSAEPGKPPMGPFYELETSSPAAALKPGAFIQHVQRTIHLTGPQATLDAMARAKLGVGLAEITAAFGK